VTREGGDPASTFELDDLDRVRDGLERAVHAANDAIREVVSRAQIRVGHKPGEGPVTEADHAADDVLHRELMPLIEGAHWLSEESRQVGDIRHGEPTWVVDPLDGTREFLRGLPEFGVSVGLFFGDRLVLGAVGLPVEQSVLSGLLADDRREARRDGDVMPALDEEAPVSRVVVSRHDYEWREIQYAIPYDVYPCGSAAVKLVRAADGDVYFSTGPRSVWDVAGGVAVLRAVGGDLIGIDGEPLLLSPLHEGVPPYVAAAAAPALELLTRVGVLQERS
jgi:3'-phosphoadenosine 5'-phosphosulfate (PAPS) 3'-phosphatase